MRARLLLLVAVVVSAVSCDDSGFGTQFGTSPGSSAKLAFTVQPTTVKAGAAITPSVQVSVQSATGTTIPTATNNITVEITSGTGTNGALLSGTKTVTAVNGIATFPNLVVDRSGVGYTITATAVGATSATSGPFTVNP